MADISSASNKIKKAYHGGGGSSEMPRWAVVVHGGAWKIPHELQEGSRLGVEAAARAAGEVLSHGGSAIDAVVAGCKCMEDDIVFDAGHGSCLNMDGDVEMDAVIVDGDTLNIGAVAGIRNIKNPIEVARLVLEKSHHNLFVGEGACRFAKENGIDEVDPLSLVTEDALKSWQHFKQYGTVVTSFFENNNEPSSQQIEGHDTVGVVVIDMKGSIASGTTTGGITAKAVGRVGDSPLIGCGAVADSELGGVSTTGHGEPIMKVMLAKDVLNRVEFQEQLGSYDVRTCITQSLNKMKNKVNGYGGAIALRVKKSDDPIESSRTLEWGAEFSTENMPWAFLQAKEVDGREVWDELQSGGV
jgi:L-asparaginase / beta-aspartyl-peptidase